MAKCKECGRKGKEETFNFCCACENDFCYKEGCNWLNKEGTIYVCESCSPVDCNIIFTAFSKEKNIKGTEGISINIGDTAEKVTDILSQKGFKEKYRLNKKGKNIIKYGKNGGIYFLLDVNMEKITAIGLWSGDHETDRGIKINSTKEEIINKYGENFICKKNGEYTSSLFYKDFNLIFSLVRVGQKKEIVTEILISEE